MSTDEPRIPIADALPGMGIHAFGDGEIPVSAFLLVKILDEEGSPSWGFRTTEPPNREELLGALTVQVEILKASLVNDWDVD
jgi:hypothetical protein